MKTTRIIAAVAFAAIAILSNDANAQTAIQVIDHQGNQASEQLVQGQVETRVMPEAVIQPQPPAPKLGFMGQIVYGQGMKVLSVNPGSPAARAGLEHGDVIMLANGFQIRQHGDLSRALRDAAANRGGTVNLFVKNIRGTAWQGNEYVNVMAYLYGRPMPMAQATPQQVISN